MVNVPGRFVDRPDVTARIATEVEDVGAVATQVGKSGGFQTAHRTQATSHINHPAKLVPVGGDMPIAPVVIWVG